MDDALKKALDEIDNSPIKKALAGIDNSATSKLLKEVERSVVMRKSYGLPELQIPQLHIPDIPTSQERNEYQSAGILMQRLADSIVQWRRQLPNDQQPAILALLYGGVQIRVERLAEESFHGIRIEGTLDGSPCMILAHQAGVQLLCYIQKIEKEESRRTIGFIIDGEETQV